MEPSKLLANDMYPLFYRYYSRKRHLILDLLFLKLEMLKVSGRLPPLKSEKS